LGTALRRNLEQISAIPVDVLLQQRYAKFRAYGHFTEKPPTPAEKVDATQSSTPEAAAAQDGPVHAEQTDAAV